MWSPDQEALDFSQFTELKRIGSGKFGKVFRARERESNTMVALKVVEKKLLDQYNFYGQIRKELEIQYLFVKMRFHTRSQMR